MKTPDPSNSSDPSDSPLSDSSDSSRTRSGARARRLRRLGVLGVTVAAGVAAGALARRLSRRAHEGTNVGRAPLGWGNSVDSVDRPQAETVATPDGAQLAVWDVKGAEPDAPVVVLPHCWGCSHEIWVPVARRLVEQGYRVVLYNKRGHGASTRGSTPLSVETLADDLALVLVTTDVHDAVLAGHSMGGMTIMSLATHRAEVLRERARAVVLVSTAATGASERSVRHARAAGAFIGSPLVTRALQAPQGHLLVRGVFGRDPMRSQMVLTRDLFAGCDGPVRGQFLASMASMNLLKG